MDWLDWHRARYPLQEAQDVVKIVFQSMMGCGHLLADEESVTRRIASEMAANQPDPAEPLTEPMGDYLRLNLRRAMAEGIPAAWIARLMLLTAKIAQPATRRAVYDALLALGDADEATAARVLDEDWLPGHSAAYHSHYAPAYRVIHASLARAVEALRLIAALPEKACSLIAIDGCCASGKSTLAGQLAYTLDAPVARMDDFFTPHPQKTPERLAQPGGNADTARFREEFLTPYLMHGHASYRPYDCHTDALAAPVEVPAARYCIVEGTYCLHPDMGRPYDLQLFLRVPRETQLSRIRARSGVEMLQRFVSAWIPLEEAYFAAFGLPDGDCVSL